MTVQVKIDHEWRELELDQIKIFVDKKCYSISEAKSEDGLLISRDIFSGDNLTIHPIVANEILLK